MNLLKPLFFSLILSGATAWAQSDCKPRNPEDTKVVDRGPVKTVMGPLAEFDPCHRSVRLDTPSFFAQKRGEKPPLVIIAHGGGGLGSYERDFARLMNQHGYATLVFDAFEMNGLTPLSDLVLYQMSNGGRQRMIFKATLGAYQWVLGNGKVDTDKVFFQGLSNGAAVVLNMAGAVDAAKVRGVIAEGGPSTGIGFPDEIKVPVLLIYGSADNYGGLKADYYMHLRGLPCGFNDYYPLAPPGFAQFCSRTVNTFNPMPSPQSWFEGIKAKGLDVQMLFVEGGGHGIMFDNFSASAMQLAGGRMFYRSRGAPADTRQKLQKQVLEFMESKL